MEVKALQYLWKTQGFGQRSIYTTEGLEVKVMDPGRFNPHATPHFLDAHLVVDGVDWRGDVAMDHKGSDWNTRQYQGGEDVDDVILHLVWEDDKAVDAKGKRMFTIALSSFARSPLFGLCGGVKAADKPVPCAAFFSHTAAEHWEEYLEKVLLKRLKAKYRWISNLLAKNDNHSDATTYQVLASAFGFGRNNASFLSLSERVPFGVVEEYSGSLRSLEALLFGGAGFLDKTLSRRGYVASLAERYAYFRDKHKLPAPLNKEVWSFFRTRPQNFPTLRIAQLARVLYHQKNLFDFFLNTTYEDFVKRMRQLPSTYWRTHYLMDKKSSRKIGGMGYASINSLVINVVVPLLVAYGDFRGEVFYLKRAIDLLKRLPAEKNRITKMWQKIGVKIANAFGSQACVALLPYCCRLPSCSACDVVRQTVGKDQHVLA